MSDTVVMFPPSVREAWEWVRARLRHELGSRVFDSWFASARLEEERSTASAVCLSVAHPFLARQVRQPLYFPTLERLFAEALGRPVKVRIIARPLCCHQPLAPLKPANRPRPAGIARAGESDSGNDQPDFPLGREVRMEDVIRFIAKRYGCTVLEMKSPRRSPTIVRPRRIAMYLVRTVVGRSYWEIARYFGGREATTVLAGVREIERLRQEDAVFDAAMQSYIRTVERWKSEAA